MSSRWELANRLVTDWATRVGDTSVKDVTKSEHGGLVEVTRGILQLSQDGLATGGHDGNNPTARLIRDSSFGALLSTLICVQGANAFYAAR